MAIETLTSVKEKKPSINKKKRKNRQPSAMRKINVLFSDVTAMPCFPGKVDSKVALLRVVVELLPPCLSDVTAMPCFQGKVDSKGVFLIVAAETVLQCRQGELGFTPAQGTNTKQ